MHNLEWLPLIFILILVTTTIGHIYMSVEDYLKKKGRKFRWSDD